MLSGYAGGIIEPAIEPAALTASPRTRSKEARVKKAIVVYRSHSGVTRHYAEEKALILATLDLLDERPNLVTFNGRSFDWPMGRAESARAILYS